MSTRQLAPSDFSAHCQEEIRTVQNGSTVVEILSSGKVVAVLSPPLPEEGLSDTDAAQYDFWQTSTAGQQADQQHVPLAATAETLLGGGTEKEWAGFDEALDQWRSEQPLQPVLTYKPDTFAAF